MSAITSRTRSSRKVADSGIPGNGASQLERGSRSPSRLPVKPSTRSTSVTSRPPSVTGSLGNVSMKPPPPRANTSAKSTSTGLQRSASNRLSTPPSNAEPEPVKKDRSRPPVTTSRHLRNTSISSATTTTKDANQVRTRSSSTHSVAPSLRPPTRGSTGELKPQNVQQEPQHRRPAFSTLQQHFSPAKNLAPKPHPAAFLAPPSPSKLPSNVAISAETAKLQNELLQLHLLHKDAACVDREWKSSAKRKMHAHFDSVVDQNDQLIRLEVRENGKINAAALKTWQELGVSGWGLEEKILVLDEFITNVWNMNESGGKYAKIVKKFEKWVQKCQDVMNAREHDDGLADDEVVFLEALDSGWKDDCLILAKKLETWRDQLKDTGNPDSGSSLGAVINGTKKLVRGMLEELSLMADIERDAMSMELRWIKSMNDDSLDDDKGIPVAGAVWRSR